MFWGGKEELGTGVMGFGEALLGITSTHKHTHNPYDKNCVCVCVSASKLLCFAAIHRDRRRAASLQLILICLDFY